MWRLQRSWNRNCAFCYFHAPCCMIILGADNIEILHFALYSSHCSVLIMQSTMASVLQCVYKNCCRWQCWEIAAFQMLRQSRLLIEIENWAKILRLEAIRIEADNTFWAMIKQWVQQTLSFSREIQTFLQSPDAGALQSGHQQLKAYFLCFCAEVSASQ